MPFVFVTFLSLFLGIVFLPRSDSLTGRKAAVSSEGSEIKTPATETFPGPTTAQEDGTTHPRIEQSTENKTDSMDSPAQERHRHRHHHHSHGDATMNHTQPKQTTGAPTKKTTESQLMTDTNFDNFTHGFSDSDNSTALLTQSSTSTESAAVVNTTQYSDQLTTPPPERTTQANMYASSQCPKCGNKDQEKQLRVEQFKQHLLKMLGMTSAPVVNGTIARLPFDFYLGETFSINDDDDEEDDIDNTPKPREIFVFGDDVTHRCRKQRSAGCYTFNLTGQNIDPDEVDSVDLWIYKHADPNDRHIQTFMVSELDEMSKDGESKLRIRNIVKRIETTLKYGWMKFFVRKTVIRWLQKPQRNNGLSVVCKTCRRQSHRALFAAKEGLRPILVFYMNQNRRMRRRVRRQTTACTEGGNKCCHKEQLAINFRDIGWNYIMAPETIRMDFCTGSCNGILAAYHNHTKVMKSVAHSSIDLKGAEIRPCCSPVAWKPPQSLLYRDHLGAILKVDIPDLIVKKCGCT